MRSEVNMKWMLMLLQCVRHYIPRIVGPVQPPDVVSCARQSPTNAGPAVAHAMPSTPAPLPAIPAAFVSHRPDKILP